MPNKQKAKKKSDKIDRVLALVLIVASAFSSKKNAAKDSSKNPIAIVQNVYSGTRYVF
jgi:hypothetical protein